MAAVLVASCSDDGGGGAGGEGTTSGATTSTSMYPGCTGEADSTLGCNGARLCGVKVDLTRIAQPVPAMTGGDIVDGVYLLTAYNEYTGASGMSGTMPLGLEQVKVLRGTAMSVTRGSAGTAQASSGTFIAAGTQLTFASTCPNVSDVPYPYTADGDTLRLIAGGVGELVFTRTAG